MEVALQGGIVLESSIFINRETPRQLPYSAVNKCAVNKLCALAHSAQIAPIEDLLLKKTWRGSHTATPPHNTLKH